MLEVGRLCIKTAGRDATKTCVIVEVIDEKFVTIDGNTRRKKVNKLHLEPLKKTIDIKKGASTKEVLEAFEKEGIPVSKHAEPKKRDAPKPQTKKVKKGADKKEKEETSSESKKTTKKEN
jgi:large subunit ribosomal protein L14e